MDGTTKPLNAQYFDVAYYINPAAIPTSANRFIWTTSQVGGPNLYNSQVGKNIIGNTAVNMSATAAPFPPLYNMS